MAYTVFFSYQSDTEHAWNKDFITSVLESLKPDFAKKNIELIVDFGFRGTAGNPPLAEAMFKKAQDCDLFISDVTFTASTLSNSDKLVPNPNVLLETGYSWATHTFNRTILLINIAFGDYSKSPVDMVDLRHAIDYTLNADSYENPEKREATFTKLRKDLRKAILTAFNSEIKYQIDKWNPLRVYQDWHGVELDGEYILIEELKQKIIKLREGLSVPGNVERIIGPPESGRTRLAYEIFKENGDLINEDSLLNKILYYDLDEYSYKTIEEKIHDLRHLGQHRILIIDNCDISGHKKISNELHKSQISLLSIGRKQGNPDITATVIIEDDIPAKIAESLIRKTYQDKIEESVVIQMIVESAGKVNKAISYTSANIQSGIVLKQKYEEKWQQLLGTELFDRGALKILESISVFENIGISGRYEDQGKFIADVLCKMDFSEFLLIIGQLKERKLIKSKGDFIWVSVSIVEFARQWLSENKEKLSEIIHKALQMNLSRALGNKLITLCSGDQKTEFINALSENKALFYDYSFINSKSGSEIIHCLCEVLPELICSALYEALMKKSIEELQYFSEGRRYTVWALEKLAFRKETFRQAAAILLKLAIAENETYANNATNQFFHLFQPILAGTEETLFNRFQFLAELYTIDEYKEMALRAMGRGLQTESYIRSGGAERQAGVELRDFAPTHEQLKEYWISIINFLKTISLDDADCSEIAEDVLYSKYTQQLIRGLQQEIFEAINEIIEKKQELNESIRQVFGHVIGGIWPIRQEIIDYLKELLEKYSGKTIRDRIINIVQLPTYIAKRTDDGIVDLAEIRVREWANELVKSNDKSWLEELSILSSDEQRQTFAFANEIGKTWENREEIIDKVIEVLNGIPFEHQNYSFVEGFLSGVNDHGFTRDVIDRFIAIPAICYEAIRMTRLLDLQMADLNKLMPIINENPKFAIALQYINIQALSEEQIEEFLIWLKDIGEFGIWCAIDLIHTYHKRTQNNSERIVSLIEKLLIREGILNIQSPISFSRMQYYDLANIIIKKDSNSPFVVFLTKEIIRFCGADEIPYDSYNQYLLGLLLDESFETTWPLFGNALLDKTSLVWYRLNNMLKDHKNYKNHVLLKWAEEHIPEGPIELMRFVPYERTDENRTPCFTDIVLDLINMTNGDEHLLNELSARIHSYGFSGSAIPIFESKIKLFQTLIEHAIPAVRDFGQKGVDEFTRGIEREKRNEENYNLGHY